MAQFGSALDWGSRGRGFKSRQPDVCEMPEHSSLCSGISVVWACWVVVRMVNPLMVFGLVFLTGLRVCSARISLVSRSMMVSADDENALDGRHGCLFEASVNGV